ncbi:cytochrome P450 [Sporichthya sp.]|uniref:cytochrome P450 n=1 Tax=Sporichthya sp. TaxID=65475 RepID=UPI0017B16BBF|nr:cytochrome P450 [Sporichthya sp.]MBA3742846.1 cytochrome P450 [Sporichthya sp.]
MALDTSTLEPIIDKFSSLRFWALPPAERLDYFTYLRENDPISWHGPPDSIDPSIPNAQGFWSVVKHADIQYVSRNPQIFSSAEGVFIDDFPQLEQMLSFIVTDAPRHGQMRGVVSAAFTPKHTRKMEEDLNRIVAETVDSVAHLGEGDLCQLITKLVPGRVFATYFGMTDPEQIQFVMDAAEQLGAWNDPEYAHIGSPLQVFADASMKLQSVALELAKQRRENPTEDLMSWVAQAHYEGQKMTVEEVGVFFALLAGAANDTTRHGMAQGLILFQQHPDQLAYVMEDFENRWEDAVNEILRFEPPLYHFRRTATEDTELGGKTIRKGEKLALWYVSGCRDAEVFENPDVFDVTRPSKANPHQAFGGGGPHYCIGHMIGRSMLRAEMYEIYTRMRDLKVGEPVLMLSNFMNGVMKLPGTWTPESR